MPYPFLQTLKIPQVNEEYLINLKETHINYFKNKINNPDKDDELDDVTKEYLIKILMVRLDGIIPKKKFELNTLDWEDPKLNNYLGVLEDFNDCYFELNKFFDGENKILSNNLFDSIEKIAYAYKNLNEIDFNEDLGVKKYLVKVLKLTDAYDESVDSFQYVLITYGISEFISKINKLYPNALNFTFDKIINKLNNRMTFVGLISVFTKIIKDYMRNSISSNKNLINLKNKQYLIDELYKVETNVKCIFWIVYHNELKYYDNILNMYAIELNHVERLCKKYEDDEFEMNVMIGIEEKTNYLIEELQKNVDSKVKNLNLNLGTNSDSQENEKNTNILNNLIDGEIEQLAKIHLTDPDENNIIKVQLEVQKQIIKMNMLLDNTFDIFSKLVGGHK